jgi:ABC-type branched-subunit amino acid transport system substrate-binding protein
MKVWSIKDAIIALLGVLCLFLMLYGMGAFDYHGTESASESYRAYAIERSRAVARAPEWNIALAAPVDMSMGSDIRAGLDFAIKKMNETGGVLGKALRLELFETSRDFLENKYLVQSLCEKMETALLFGPWHTAEVPSTRAITQFQALPMTSITLRENLSNLNPELYLSLRPDLSLWLTPIIEAMKERNCKQVLIITPENPHYGGVFASRLEQRMDENDFFTETFRTNYVPPLSMQSVYEILKLYRDNLRLDAIVFTGERGELAALGEAMRLLSITTPVFGTDQLEWASDLNFLDFPAELLYPVLDGNILTDQERTLFINPQEKEPSLWVRYVVLAAILFRDAMLENGSYEPANLVATMQRHWEKRFQRDKLAFAVTMHLKQQEKEP